jgi:hypothetical protein
VRGYRLYLDIVHKSADEKDAAAGMAKEVLFCQGIWKRRGIEAFALIGDADFQVVAGARDLKVDSLIGVVTIAVDDGVYHAFAGGHADFVKVVFGEAGGCGGIHNEGIGTVDAIEGGLELLVHVLLFNVLMRLHSEVHDRTGYGRKSSLTALGNKWFGLEPTEVEE